MKLRTLIVSSLIGLSLVACNAGSAIPTTSTPSSTPTPSATATATPIPAPSPFTAVQAAVTAPTSGGSVSAPTAGGFAPVLTIPGLTAAAAGTASTGSSAPAGVSTFAARRAESKPGNATSLVYLSFMPTTSTTITPGTLSIQVGLPGGYLSSAAYYLAVFDGSLWHTEYSTTAGAATSDGMGVKFSFTLTSNFAITAGKTYAVCLYAVPAAATPDPNTLSATPTPAVSATATSTSSPTATSSATPTTTPSATATSSASPAPTSTSIATTGTVNLASAQTLNGFTSNDGSTGSLTLPAIGGTVNYSILTAVPSGVTAPTNGGTFIGGATVTAGSAIALTTTPNYGYTLVPSATIAGKTIYFYVLSNGSAAYLAGTATAPAAGTTLSSTTATVPMAINIPSGSSYTLALYYK